MVALCLPMTYLAEAREIRLVRHPLEHQRGGAIGERLVGEVAATGDPADIGGAPEDVAIMVVGAVLTCLSQLIKFRILIGARQTRAQGGAASYWHCGHA
jgi:hypothetical protein